MTEKEIGQAVMTLVHAITEVSKKRTTEGNHPKIEKPRYDQLMNKRQLAEKLGCHISKVNEHYVYQPNFPIIKPPGGKEERFSHVAVDKWIVDHMTYN